MDLKLNDLLERFKTKGFMPVELPGLVKDVLNIVSTGGNSAITTIDQELEDLGWGIGIMDNVTYELINDGVTVIGYIDGGDDSDTPVFQLDMVDVPNGGYEYEQFAPLDHEAPGEEDDITLKFSYTITDSNGDSLTSNSLYVTIDDDSPTIAGEYEPIQALVEEDGLSIESGNEPPD